MSDIIQKITLPSTTGNNGIKPAIEVSNNGVVYEQQIFNSFGELNGVPVVYAKDGNNDIRAYEYAHYIGWTSPAIPKSQLLGLLTQFTNLAKSSADTAKAMRSVADLYGKTEEVLAELEAIRSIVSKS